MLFRTSRISLLLCSVGNVDVIIFLFETSVMNVLSVHLWKLFPRNCIFSTNPSSSCLFLQNKE